MWWLIGVGGLLAIAIAGFFIMRIAMRDPNNGNEFSKDDIYTGGFGGN
jgi:hypothetical protein